MKKHNLKINKANFQSVIKQEQTHIITNVSENCKLGELITLEEYDAKGYTGRYIVVEITAIEEYPKMRHAVSSVKLKLEMGAKIE